MLLHRLSHESCKGLTQNAHWTSYRLNGHRRLTTKINREIILVDGEGLQDTECPVSRFSKCRKLIWNRMLSGHSRFSVCRRLGRNRVLSGHSLRFSGHSFIHTHASARTHTHTHTHYNNLFLTCMLQVLARTCSKIALYPAFPYRRAMHAFKHIINVYGFSGVIWCTRMQCQPWPRYKGTSNKKKMRSVRNMDAGTSE